MTRILLMLCLVAFVPVYAQSQYNISVDNVPLKKVMKQIERYGEYYFAYRTEFLQHDERVTVHVTNGTIDDVMKQALRGLRLNYLIVGNMITVRPDTSYASTHKQELLTITGKVVNEAGEPVQHVSVSENGSQAGAFSGSDGHFNITVKPNTLLRFTSVGYEPASRLIKERSFITVLLKLQVKDLDETVITGYGKTSKRYNTGAIYKINSADIARQPVSDPLGTLQGRVPGLLITQSNGLPGSTYKVQLRGQSSIGIVPGQLPPNDPLFIIDGVPYAPNNYSIIGVTSGSPLGDAGRSPFSFINTGDIDHIEILKDADATAIYGSRGSNGVILISTKKGKAGRPVFNINVNTGWSRITRYADMMNTAQYVQMRTEALSNDGLTADISTAPDLISWDTARYTDFRKMLIGGEAVTNNVQLSFSGGSKRLKYYLGAGYHRETTVFPGDIKNERFSGHVNLHYQSKDTNLNITLSMISTHDRNLSIASDLTNYVSLAPHTPVLYDSTGKLIWEQGNLGFANPLSFLLQPYESTATNLLGNLDINYRIARNLTFKTSIGYNWLRFDDISIRPGYSQSTSAGGNPKGLSNFGKVKYDSWIAEPQLEYNRYLGIGKISGLVGATMQLQNHSVATIEASDFPNDDDLRNVNAAGIQKPVNLNTEYRYGGVFARLTSILLDKYLINLTGRTDGSSRFGPGKQVGMFWSTGLGWIFSNEPFIKSIPFISFGKLRTSYGVTGNDQIGDYKYLDKWQELTGAYMGRTGIHPVQLADSNYSWEVSRKLEAAIELGLFKDRIMITAAHYRNRTGNQLIAYVLPGITGFNSYAAKNSPALVQNTGWELQLQTKNRINPNWQLNGNILLTIPRNKLIAFPNLATSSYKTKLAIGQSLSVLNTYEYKGVNANTGLFEFVDQDGDGSISYPNDYRLLGHVDPQWYGSVQANIQYKRWQLDIFWEIRKQRASSYLYTMYSFHPPGTMLKNQPIMALHRWPNCKECAALQQYTTGVVDATSDAISNFVDSDGYIKDASFARLRNIELSWQLSTQWMKNFAIKHCRFYIQAQNIITITPYKGFDPETRSISTLPPLRTIAGGIELSF
jgi:TonB-dependent starch-binding outer membrane protein SusC